MTTYFLVFSVDVGAVHYKQEIRKMQTTPLQYALSQVSKTSFPFAPLPSIISLCASEAWLS